jgi:hypothetical protein
MLKSDIVEDNLNGHSDSEDPNRIRIARTDRLPNWDDSPAAELRVDELVCSRDHQNL